MCFGELYVTIILGNKTKQKVECGFCQNGTSSPSGTATTWEPNAIVKSEKVSGFSLRSGISYELGCRNINESELYSSEDEAEKFRLIEFKRVSSQVRKWHLDKFVSCSKKQIWSIGYHKASIKTAQRSIEWHEQRLVKCKSQKLGE